MSLKLWVATQVLNAFRLSPWTADHLKREESRAALKWAEILIDEARHEKP